MEKWKTFLESLRTGGGRIFVLSFLTLVFAYGIFILAYYVPAYEKAADAIVPILAMLVGALLTVLRGDKYNNNKKEEVNGEETNTD